MERGGHKRKQEKIELSSLKHKENGTVQRLHKRWKRNVIMRAIKFFKVLGSACAVGKKKLLFKTLNMDLFLFSKLNFSD